MKICSVRNKNSFKPAHSPHFKVPGSSDALCFLLSPSCPVRLTCAQIMPRPHAYKFCFGPWNLSEGQDAYGPPVRPTQSFDWKLAQLKKHGFDAMMFHDDDAVPGLDGKSGAQILKEA